MEEHVQRLLDWFATKPTKDWRSTPFAKTPYWDMVMYSDSTESRDGTWDNLTSLDFTIHETNNRFIAYELYSGYVDIYDSLCSDDITIHFSDIFSEDFGFTEEELFQSSLLYNNDKYLPFHQFVELFKISKTFR